MKIYLGEMMPKYVREVKESEGRRLQDLETYDLENMDVKDLMEKFMDQLRTTPGTPRIFAINDKYFKERRYHSDPINSKNPYDHLLTDSDFYN